MSKSIRVSEKHGVNPSLGICFWCGGDDGTVLLVGKLPGDKEAPRRMLASYDPCDACKEQFGQGVALIEAHEGPTFEGQPAIQQGPPELYPTGCFMVVKDEALPRLFENTNLDAILAHRKAYIDADGYEKLLERFREAGLITDEGEDDGNAGK